MALYSLLAQGAAKVGGLTCNTPTTFHLALKSDRMTFIFRWTTSTFRGLNGGYFFALSNSEPQAKAFKGVGVQCCIIHSQSGNSASPAVQLMKQYTIVGCCVLASRSVTLAGAHVTSCYDSVARQVALCCLLCCLVLYE